MRYENHDSRDELDEILFNELSRKKPEFDFDQWKKKHQYEIDAFKLQTQCKKHPISDQLWRTIMDRKIIKFAIAAMVVIAVGVSIYLYTGPVDISTRAFAQVIEQMQKARTVRYKSTLYYNDEKPTTSEVFINENGVQRNVLENGMVMFFDRANGIQLTLFPSSKCASILRTIGVSEKRRFYNHLDWLMALPDKATSYIGEETIDGVKTYLYKVDESFRTISIWTDTRTNLPVRVITEDFPSIDPNIAIPKLTILGKDFGLVEDWVNSISLGGQNRHKTVYTDFEWNAILDESLFDTTVPEDYAVKELQANDEFDGTEVVISALKFWSENSSDPLPGDIYEVVDPNTMRALLIHKFNTGQDPNEQFRNATEFMGNVIFKAVSFAQDKKAHKNWYANSEPVAVGESDKPLYWWKNENAQTYRVIYGDLTARDVNQIP